MKKYIVLVFIGILCIPSVFSQKEVTSKITGATVFFNGAQVVREASVQLQSGTTVLLFTNLPQNINPNTIVVESESAITLLSVKHNLNYLKNQEKPKEVTRMEDSLKLMQQNLQHKSATLQVYREEETMLIANKSVGGQNNGVQAENLKNTTEFFRTRMMDVKNKQFDLGLEIQKISETINKLNNQIAQVNATRGGAVSEVYVSVSTKSAVNAKINMNYYVPNSNWTPMYDLRATQVGKPVQLSLKANVINNTGESWDNVKLTLSSANPLQSGVLPTLNPWYLYPYRATTRSTDSNREKNYIQAEQPISAMDYESAGGIYKTTASYTTVQQGMTTIEYVISIPYTIPSDGKEYTVDIQEYTMPATYEYQVVPKMDKDAFLMARITGWEEYNLLPGETNLFAEGKFIGNSYIDPASVKDTLDISLGRDKSITINREMLKDFSSEKIIGSNKTIVRTYEISVRNRKNTGINIVIIDQIPLSNQKDITVSFDEKQSPDVEYDATRGTLKWKLTVKPNETIKLKYTYTVKHPKDMSLQVW